MRILLVHNQYKVRGGEGTHVIQMKSMLEKAGHVVIPFYKDSRDVEKLTLGQKIILPFRNIYSLATLREIKELVRKEKPDIAQVYHVTPLISPSVYYALFKMNIPVIQILQNYRYLCLNGIFQDPKGEVCELCTSKGLRYALSKRCYRDSFFQTLAVAISLKLHRGFNTYKNKIDLMITTSDFLRSKLIANSFSQNKVLTINGFIDVFNMKPNYKPDNYVIYLGRLSAEKGLFTLLEALRELPQIHLKIMGEGPLRNKMEEYIAGKNMKNVEFLGYISGSERFDFLSRAKCMVIPSECYDNFPFGVLESLALGTPVIGTCMGGIPEQIEDGKTGFLFEAKDSGELGAKIDKIFSDSTLALDMRYNARKRAENKFSQVTALGRFEEIYKSLLVHS